MFGIGLQLRTIEWSRYVEMTKLFSLVFLLQRSTKTNVDPGARNAAVRKLAECEAHFAAVMQRGLRCYFLPLQHRPDLVSATEHGALFLNLDTVSCSNSSRQYESRRRIFIERTIGSELAPETNFCYLLTFIQAYMFVLAVPRMNARQ